MWMWFVLGAICAAGLLTFLVEWLDPNSYLNIERARWDEEDSAE